MIQITEAFLYSKQMAKVLKGKMLVKEAYLGGKVIYCPHCQK